MLTIVPTPIGNLKDITLRSLETLEKVDGIICEDSRRTAILLNHFQIKNPMLVLNDYNEASEFPRIVEKLKMGQNLALVSDAGTPLISDPGFKLVRECLKENIPVDSLPGPSSVVTSLILSGLPPDKFIFLGFLPDKPSHRLKIIQTIKKVNDILPATYIIFVSPFKLIKNLEEMVNILGDIEIILARELTKIHQQVDKKPISQWLEHFKKQPPKGEFVLLFNLKDV